MAISKIECMVENLGKFAFYIMKPYAKFKAKYEK